MPCLAQSEALKQPVEPSGAHGFTRAQQQPDVCWGGEGEEGEPQIWTKKVVFKQLVCVGA